MYRSFRSARSLIQWRRTIHLGQAHTLSAPVDIPDETSAKARWNLDALQEVDATPAVDITSEGAEVAKSIGEVELTGYSPVSVVQYFLEVMHVGTGLPWWATIAATTVIVRLALSPIVIRLQANAVKMNNLRPEIEPLMKKMQEYKQSGEKMLASNASAKMMSIYHKNDCNPLKMMLMPFIQIPIFITFFITLRRMTGLPVAGMTTEGTLWFQNLTMADPYYALPVLASLSFMAVMQIGGEIGVTNPQLEKVKNVMRGMAVLIIPISATFPSGLFMYWITSSLFSIAQVATLRANRVRKLLGIPQRQDVTKTPAITSGVKKTDKKKGIFQQVKESYRNMAQLEEARRDERLKQKAYDDMLHGKIELFDNPPSRRSKKNRKPRIVYEYAGYEDNSCKEKKKKSKKDKRMWKRWIRFGTYNTGWKGAYARKNWSKTI